jgi:Cache domain
MKTTVKIIAVVAVLAVIGVVVWLLLRGSPRKNGKGPANGKAGAATAGTGVQAEKRADVAAVLERLNARVVEKTKNYLYPAKMMVETTARTLNRHSSIRTDEYFERYMVKVLRAYPQLDHIYIADPHGNRLLATVRGATGVETDLIDRSGKEPFRIRKRWDPAGKAIGTERHTEKQLLANPALGDLNSPKTGIYDPRVRPWYQLARKQRKICWTDVYVFNQNGQPGITTACPAFNARGELLFVVAADFEIKNICRFLSETRVGKEGLAFIVKSNGDLVAYPDASKVLKSSEKGPVFAKAREVVPDWVKAALAAYEDKRENMFVFGYKQRRYIASFAPFLKSVGNDWKLVVVVPENDLLSAASDG